MPTLDPRYTYGVYGVLSVSEIPNGRSGKKSQDFTRTYVRTYRIQVDDNNVSVMSIRNALFAAAHVDVGYQYKVGSWDTVTGAGDAFYEADLSFCTDVEVSQDAEDGFTWIAKASYAPFDPRENHDDPLGEPPILNWEVEKFEEIADVDIHGDAVVNSAGDYFDPPIVRDQSRPILTITRNEKTFDPTVAYSYADKVNSAVFFGAPPRTVKMEAPVAVSKWSQNVSPDGFYWEVHYAFHFNRDTWDKVVLDQGMRESASGTRKQIIVDGAPVSSPVLLSGGSPLEPGGTPEYLTFLIFEEADFTTIFNFFPET